MLKLAAAICVLITAPAHAVLVTVDPDDFASGTNITNAFAGVQLKTFANEGFLTEPTMTDVYSAADPACASASEFCNAITGNSVFSPTATGPFGFGPWNEASAGASCFTFGSGSSSCRQDFRVLLVAFETLTDYVEISGHYHADSPVFIALDSSRNRIGGSQRSLELPGEFRNYTATFQSTSANIAYIVAGSWSAASSLDALRYNSSVPEPDTLSLLGAGLLGLLAARRRKLVR